MQPNETPPTNSEENDLTTTIDRLKADAIRNTKGARVILDSCLQFLKSLTESRERSISIEKLQEAIMWLGMDLKERGTPNPYPNSYDPTNAVVDPTADGLKL